MPIEMHVHVVGNGAGGTGCWLRVRGWRRGMAGLLMRHIGLPLGALHGDLDWLYVERLLEQVWGYDFNGDTRAVDSAIKRLRAGLRSADPQADCIEAVRGLGYKYRRG